MSFKDTKKKIEAAKIQPAEQYNVTKTLNAGIRIVKVAGVEIGVASSDEDEKKMLEILSHFGTNLESANDVRKAMTKMYETTVVATDLKDAGLTPDKEFMGKSGKPIFEIAGVLYDKDGNEFAK